VVGRGFEGEGVIQSIGANSFGGNIFGSEGRYGTSVLLNIATGSLTIGGTVSLRDVQMEIVGAGDLTIAGGIKGGTTTDGWINGFEQRFYDLPVGTVPNNLADVYASAFQIRNVLNGALGFADDSAFNLAAEIDINGIANTFSTVWTTTFTPSEDGVWQFQTNGSIDDVASIWIDLNQSGGFEPDELVGVRINAGSFGPISTPALIAGERYLLAFAMSDTATNSAFPGLQFKAPSGAFTSVNPSSGAQDGLWSVEVEKEAIVKNSTGKLTIAGSSTYNGGTDIDAGELILTNTSGSGTGLGFVNLVTGTILSGTGKAAGEVTVASGATVTPGLGGIGTLFLGNLSTGGD